MAFGRIQSENEQKTDRWFDTAARSWWVRARYTLKRRTSLGKQEISLRTHLVFICVQLVGEFQEFAIPMSKLLVLDVDIVRD